MKTFSKTTIASPFYLIVLIKMRLTICFAYIGYDFAILWCYIASPSNSSLDCGLISNGGQLVNKYKIRSLFIFHASTFVRKLLFETKISNCWCDFLHHNFEHTTFGSKRTTLYILHYYQWCLFERVNFVIVMFIDACPSLYKVSWRMMVWP